MKSIRFLSATKTGWTPLPVPEVNALVQVMHCCQPTIELKRCCVTSIYTQKWPVFKVKYVDINRVPNLFVYFTFLAEKAQKKCNIKPSVNYNSDSDVPLGQWLTYLTVWWDSVCSSKMTFNLRGLYNNISTNPGRLCFFLYITYAWNLVLSASFTVWIFASSFTREFIRVKLCIWCKMYETGFFCITSYMYMWSASKQSLEWKAPNALWVKNNNNNGSDVILAVAPRWQRER